MEPLPVRIGPDEILDPVSMDDAEELYAAIDRNRDRLREWLPWVRDGYHLGDTTRFIVDAMNHNTAGTALTMMIRSKGVLCGAIGLHQFNPHRGSSIGYWIDGAHEGQGIVTRACRAIVDTGFRNYKLHRIEIQCAVGNSRSSAIAQRLDFNEEGILREAEWLYDHFVSLRVFSMLEHDWRSCA
jgi:ribosomal-protein-serine acetyltransferase